MKEGDIISESENGKKREVVSVQIFENGKIRKIRTKSLE